MNKMEEYKLKMAVIAGASKALDLKSKGKSDGEVLKEIAENTEEILEKIDEE